MQDSGFGVRVQGLGSRVWGVGFLVWVLGYGLKYNEGLDLGVSWGLEFSVYKIVAANL